MKNMISTNTIKYETIFMKLSYIKFKNVNKLNGKISYFQTKDIINKIHLIIIAINIVHLFKSN